MGIERFGQLNRHFETIIKGGFRNPCYNSYDPIPLFPYTAFFYSSACTMCSIAFSGIVTQSGRLLIS